MRADGTKRLRETGLRMKAVHHFALLAPVPLEHLRSGQKVSEQKGFVAFGTRKWEMLRKLDEMREGAPIPVLIYPSHEDVPAKESFVVSWYGWYVGHVDSVMGQHPLGMEHRPPHDGSISRRQ